MKQRIHAVTLLELLIGIVLLSIIVLVISSIDLFSHHQVINSERRVRIQNEVSYVLEHMTKEISRAIGNELVNNDDTVVDTGAIGGDTAIRIYIDANGNGLRDTPPAAATDFWRAYRFTGIAGPNPFQIWYCPRCTGPVANPCNACAPVWGTAANILSRQIRNFTPTKPGEPGPLNQNNVDIQLTACWDPDGAPYACGSPDNPEVMMRTNIKMPSVSTN